MHSVSVPDILSILVSVGFPNLMNIISREHWSGTAKWFILAALSTGSGVVSQLADSLQHGTAFNGQQTLLTSTLTLALATGIHYGQMTDTTIGKASALAKTELPVPPSAGNQAWEPSQLPYPLQIPVSTVDVTPVPEAPAPVVDVTPAPAPATVPIAPVDPAPAAPVAPQQLVL